MGWQTLLVTCCTCFLAGSTFHHWVVDHNTFWTNPATEEAISRALKYYTLLGSVRYTPLPYIWLAVAGVALVTMAWRAGKGLLNSQGERFGGGHLFDAGCCLLLGQVMVSQASEAFPALVSIADHPVGPKVSSSDKDYLGLESSVRGLAGVNLTISVLLTGVICLQAGRFYAERAANKKRAQRLASNTKINGVPAENSTENPTSPSGSAKFEEGTHSDTGSIKGGKKTRRRAQTPYRETEAFEFESTT